MMRRLRTDRPCRASNCLRELSRPPIVSSRRPNTCFIDKKHHYLFLWRRVVSLSPSQREMYDGEEM
jgi:hypothetical protein